MNIHPGKINQILTASGLDKGSKLAWSKLDNSQYKMDLYDALSLTVDSPGFNIDQLGLPLFPIIASIHDAGKKYGFLNKTPEFEFFRHVRNAVSHGNRFTFQPSEPSRPASFNGRVINKDLEGHDFVLFTFIGIGDVLELLDHVRDNV